MEQERWRRVEELFHAASGLAPEARQAYLDEACGEDAELRRQVEMLLSKDEHAGSLLQTAALASPAATATALTGAQLGPYRILSLLGAGGMGEVYRARDTKLGRDVAIKTLPSAFARHPDRMARFRREARTLASLNHPNIAAIYGLEESQGVDCLVLELVEGRNLSGPLRVADALDISRQVAEALEAAHAKGIVHRDLKPANVKVTPEGRVKVLDFGLAKAIWGAEPAVDLSRTATLSVSETQAGHIVGTPGYMSPEQARGEFVDYRADIWAFGCMLYELLSGKRAFPGAGIADTIAAVLEREPDWQALPSKTPLKIRELLRQCLQKAAGRRLNNISEARQIIEHQQRRRSRLPIAMVVATAIVAIAIAAVLWLRSPDHPADRSQWVQLTNFPDAVTQPALSADGKMLTFIRGESTFAGPGQIYVKALPTGDPVELTHDKLAKMSPAFSPDGSRIAYTTYLAENFGWDTWDVPVFGGAPREWMKNASGLVWTGPHQLMFSEIKMGIHMGIVTAADNRMGAQDIYLPGPEPNMAHRSYLSPDRKWVLLVEMDEDHLWEQCRIVPAEGKVPGHKVGPPGGGCTSGAWTPDGKWIYLTSNAVGANHIWRQRFPDGQPELVTPGPTEEEGVAMAPDGRSFITSVALQNASLWIHDSQGERRVPVEGNTADPLFTPDGKRLCYRKVTVPTSEWDAYRDPGEVYISDLATGRSETLTPGLKALRYDVSPDGRDIIMESADSAGKPRIWIMPLDRSAPPRQVPNIEGGSPLFASDGDILFRHVEGSTMAHTSGFMYRAHRDGSGMRKIIEQPILIVQSISSDRRWLIGWAPLHGTGDPSAQAFPIDGGDPVPLGPSMSVVWSPDGSTAAISAQFGVPIPENTTYLVPLPRGQTMPPVPKDGYATEEQVSKLRGARKVDIGLLYPGPLPGQYAFYRGASLRNLYRIPIQ